MKNIALEAARAISDHGNLFLSKGINIFGLGSIGFTGIKEVASTGLVQNAIPSAQKLAQACAETPSISVYAASFGGIMLGIKYGADIYFRWKEDQKDMNEDKTDKDNIC